MKEAAIALAAIFVIGLFSIFFSHWRTEIILDSEGKLSNYHTLKGSTDIIFVLPQGLLLDSNGYKVEGADKASFRVVLVDVKENPYRSEALEFGRDKNSYYHEYKRVPFDPTKGQLIAIYGEPGLPDSVLIYHTKEKVYFRPGSGEIRELEADAKSFSPILDGPRSTYFKDNKNVFYLYGESLTTVSGADPTTFRFFGNEYFVDKNSVYYSGEKIPNVSSNGVKFIKFNGIQTSGKVFIRFQNKIYLGKTMLNVTNPDTFQDLGENYYKDSKHVYYIDSALELIAGADPATFEVIRHESNKDAKDKENSYQDGKKI